LLSACATTGVTTPGDPLERMNRGTQRFNDAVDRAALKPVATAYRDHVPQVIRTGIGNVLTNLAFPTTIVNDLLQLKLKDTLIDIGRFALNTTIGIGGLLDPASHIGIRRNDEDFGQTLGRWGVPPGPYLVLPLMGPSTFRDAPSLAVDSQTDLRVQLDLDDGTRVALLVLSVVDGRAELLSVDQTIEAAFDRYAFVRDAWLQRREYKVRDGEASDEISPEELEEMEKESEDSAEPTGPENPAEKPDQPPPEAAGASNSDTSLMPASAAMAGGRFR
ncbi:MAG: MlaA family lipoprotein, partial [Steroidobacteraceae bacterium]